MEPDSYGVYSTYFSVLKYFGAFPYSGAKDRLGLAGGGPFLLYYHLCFAASTFHAFFQLFQLLLVYVEGSEGGVIMSQLTWCLLSALPIANHLKTAGEEGEFALVVDEWCHLERKILGSTFRGVTQGVGSTVSTCYFHQRERFTFISRYYMGIGVVGGLGVGLHAYYSPTSPSYISSLEGEQASQLLASLSVVYQLWIYSIIWSNVYALEVLGTVVSSSVGHILETISYQGGVVMTRWTCDPIPILDLVSSPGGESATVSRASTAVVEKGGSKQSFEAGPGFQDFFPSDMSRIIKNLVDIEYGLEGYFDVERLIEAFNHSFGRIIPGHQFVYLLMLTIQGFNAIQFFSRMCLGGVAIYTLVILLFLLRMLVFFPAMGNLDHRSDHFIDSWMEGLRYIPKGKQTYELYWFRIKSCRLLDFRCGRYFNMERHTSLEFLFRVSEFIIVLMQIMPSIN